MKAFLKGLWLSFPVQLVFLHLRRYQVLLLFWFIIGSAINGSFMSTFGADALFLAPEYLGHVNMLSSAITGVAMGIFIMSWQITTFVLHSRHIKFLATTSKPFLKYCINNSIIPLLFLVFYSYKAVQFDRLRELMGFGEILALVIGFLVGFILLVAISFSWFFGAEQTMLRSMHPIMHEPHKYIGHFGIAGNHHHEKGLIQVEWFYNTRLKLKKPRNISHYSEEFVETIFRRHHFSAVMAIIVAFLFLAIIGMVQDIDMFKLPAAAGILIFFSILMAGAASLVYWLKSWSIPAFVLIILLVDAMFRYGWVDTRNKAYGLNYDKVAERPVYGRDSILALCSEAKMEADKKAMIAVLERWKARQDSAKPVMYILNFSGGGTRSATFAVNVLRQMDSMMKGKLMQRTFMMTGASGGMLGATYYRELYRQRIHHGRVDPNDPIHVDRISRDLLNPLFSSMVTRDIFAPAQRFRVGNYSYVKDRAHAFEEQLNENTNGILDIRLKDYIQDETEAKVPLLLFSSTVSADGRKMLLSTQPISFMMRNWPDSSSGVPGEPDAVDFAGFFRNLDPYNLRLLTAMRINATFPYVLPNVWLPTHPVVDVMDAGIRDNYGQETSIRFLNVFNDWLAANTSGVVFIQVRDRKNGAEWHLQGDNEGFTSMFTKPITVIQLNWMRMQDYYHDELIAMADDRFSFPFEKLTFSYVPASKNQAAALNFHLTNKEKSDIRAALGSPENMQAFMRASSY